MKGIKRKPIKTTLKRRVELKKERITSSALTTVSNTQYGAMQSHTQVFVKRLPSPFPPLVSSMARIFKS